MAKCKRCQREVTGPHNCEPKGTTLDDLADAVGGLFDALTSDRGSDSGCDSGGGCD